MFGAWIRRRARERDKAIRFPAFATMAGGDQRREDELRWLWVSQDSAWQKKEEWIAEPGMQDWIDRLCGYGSFIGCMHLESEESRKRRGAAKWWMPS